MPTVTETPGAKDVQSNGRSVRPAGPQKKSVGSENMFDPFGSSTAMLGNNESELLVIVHSKGMLSRPDGAATVVTKFSVEFPQVAEDVAVNGPVKAEKSG